MILPPETLNIGDLIYKRIPFVVPKYQRAFAWEHDLEVKDFVTDIKGLIEARKKSSIKIHFMGGLVSVEKHAPGTSEGRVFEIVDGQQRITTVILTISLLGEAFNQIETLARVVKDTSLQLEATSYANNIKNNYLYYEEVSPGKGIQLQLRLKLSRSDDRFFRELITDPLHNPQRDHRRESHFRLKNAYDYIKVNLIDVIIEDPNTNLRDKLNNLLLLRQSIFDDCSLILIKSDNRSEAYRLFAVLNDRGKTLSDGDLLRSYTLEMLEGHPNQQDTVENCWEQILKYRDKEIDDFLRTYYPSHQGQRAPSRDLADQYKESFFPYSTEQTLSDLDATELQKRVANIKEESEIYFEIVEGQWPYTIPTVSAWDRERLHRLIKVLKHTLCIPLLLSAKQGLSERDFADLVHLLERFVFRYITIANAHAGRLGNIYNKHSKLIRDNPTTYSLNNIRIDLANLQTYVSDELFATGLKEQLHYNQSSMKLVIRHFLTTVEDYLPWYRKYMAGLQKATPKPNKMHAFDLNQATIEHIYPQSSTSVDKALENVKHAIGNLSFWSQTDNVAAANDPFDQKKPLYQMSSVMLNQELSHLSNWDITTFETRTNELVEIAKLVFAI